MRKRKRFSLLWIFIPVLLFCFLIVVLFFYLIDPSLYKNILQERLSSSLGREVYIGNAKLNLFKGFGIVFEDIRIRDSSFMFDLLQSERVLLRPSLISLLKKEIHFKEINFDRPKIRIIKYKDGNLNITKIKKQNEEPKKDWSKTLSGLFVGSVTFRDGEIIFLDESIEGKFKTELSALNLYLHPKSSNDLEFRLKAKLLQKKKQGGFSLSGTIQNTDEFDLKKTYSDLKVELQALDISYFWPYLKRFLPFREFSGDLDLSLSYQGRIDGPFNISSKLRLKEPLLDYPQVFFYKLKPRWLNISFNLNSDLKNLIIQRLSLELPEFSIKASGRVYSFGSKDMGIEAEAQSNLFDLSGVKKYIPFKILSPQVSDSIFRAEGEGKVQIASVRLSGKIPEIEHCDRPINKDVLSIELRLNGARVKLPWNFPSLDELNGALVFKEGNLYLNDIEGKILNSRFERLNGAFYNLLNTPILSLKSEGILNISDLSSLRGSGLLSQTLLKGLSNINILSGKADYQISLRCLLKEPFNIEHRGIFLLSKLRINHRDIPFDIDIDRATIDLSNNEVRISDAKVMFGESSFLINGKWKKGEKFSPFEFIGKGNLNLKKVSNLFQSSIIPKSVREKIGSIESLSGRGEVSFKIHNLPVDPYYFYNIGFLSKGVSLKQRGISFPLIFKEGVINFSNNDLNFSNAKFLLGKSFLELSGSFRGESMNLSILGNTELKSILDFLKSPLLPDKLRSEIKTIKDASGDVEWNLKLSGKIDSLGNALKEGVIRLKGISLIHEDILLPIANLEGSIQLTPEKIHTEGLKARVGDSQIEVKGSIPRINNPLSRQIKFPLSFNISSKRLDLDSILPKKEETKEPFSFGRLKDLLSNLSIDGRFRVLEGRFKALNYKEMEGVIKTVDNKILLQPFQSKLDGGDIWGEGWIESIDKGLRFEIKPRISNIELKSFLRTLLTIDDEEKILIRGKLHIYKVELRGEGESFEKLKETLSGGLRLEIDDGVIERFNILSKIFSILNISQIFSGRLPDLKTKGLPYHKITANIHFKDGVAQTEDLIVESDAMRITMVGRLDLVKNLIDVKIGIHPLVTVDKILSKIPVAGYILTGKDKAFLSYFYEVKGNLDDPKIEAIPLRTIGETFFGVIKRLLETPLRPFKKGEE